MPEYLSNKKRKQSIGINSYSEYTDTTKIIGNVLVGFGSVGVGTTVPTQDVDVDTIRVRDTLYDYTNSGGVFGYYLVKDTGGIKWVAVPPIDSNAIFVAKNNNIVGVSSFTGLNFIADDLVGVTTNLINSNFADITIVSRWLKSGDTGIYTTKNVGIGTTIPTTDFQVGFGTTGVTIDGSIGVVSALGYYGNYAFIDQITVKDRLNVVGLGSTLVAAYLASGGGITTTGGDLYVGGSLFSNKLDIINLKVVNIEATGITTLNVGIVSTFRVTGVSTLGVTSISQLNVSGITTLGITSTKDLFVDKNLYVVGIATATRFSTGVIGSAINITSNTISGPAEIIIDPADIGDNSGAVRIKGDLFVDGEEFIVNSTTIELADFNVGIASTVGTNFLLDGAGIGIGSTNIRKTLTYDYSSDSLKSSENFDLGTGKVYKINETEVLSSTQLTVANIKATGVSTLGFATIGQLYVSGVSTFVGVGTFINDLYVGGDLYVADDIFFDELNAKNANITGITTLNVGIVSTFRVTGVSTLGVTSTKDLFVDANLKVSGITTLGITSISQLNVSGITTLGITSTTNLTSQQLNVSGITTLGITSTTNLTSQQLNVSGITTLGITSISQLNVAGILTASRIVGTSLSISGISTIANFLMTPVGTGATVGGIGVTYYGDGSQLTKISSSSGYADTAGIATNVIGGIASVTSLNVSGITTLSSIVGTSLSITGISTLGVTSTTNLTSQQLNVSGITTLGVTSTTNLITQQLRVTGITTLGVTSTTNLTSQQLLVTGITTLASIVGTSLSISGISTLGVTSTTNLTSQQLNVSGITTLGVTSTTNLTSQQLLVTGITTLASIVGTSLSISGISTIANFLMTPVGTGATVGGIGVTYYGDGRNLTNIVSTSGYASSAGIATNIGAGVTGSVPYQSNTGITSFVPNATANDKVLIWKDGIPVWGSVSAGSITGTTGYADKAGIATYASSAGIATNIGAGVTGSVPYQSNTGITSFVPNATANDKVLIWKDGIPVWGDISAGSIVGVATYADRAGIADNVIGGIASVTSLNVTGITTLASIVGTSLSISGISTLGVTSTTNLTSKQLLVTGITTLSSIVGTSLSISGISTIANFIITNVGTGATVGGVGIVTYYGDGRNLTNIVSGYATTAGIATYATNAGIATNVIGGIGSITQLQVTGVSTFTNGPILVGSSTSTGTSLQTLQVTGGAYVSGNLGVGTTNPVQKVDIVTGVGDGTPNETNAIRLRHSSTFGNAITLQMGVNNVGGGGGGGSSNQGYGYLQSVYWGGGNSTIALNPKGGGVAVGSNSAATALDVTGDLLLKTTGTNTQLSKVGFNGVGLSGSFPTFIGAFADNGVWSNGMALTFNTIRSGDVNGSTGLERMRVSSDGNLLVATTSATGTASQTLQVTGGAYVSGNLGVGTTNPTSKLTVQGDVLVSGILTASRIVGTSLSITGISTIANFRITNVGTGATVGGVGVLTYYGDGSGLTNINLSSVVGVVTYAERAGIATYADRAGIATNVIGGIASVTSLNVTGITTLASIVGTSLSITGISTLGVTSTTNLTSQQLNVTGITTLASIVGTSLSISGISTIANFLMTPVGTGATVGGVGVVTYYGDGSGLTNINPSALSGIVTYADRAGIATNVIGGIASVTSLNVTGISTLGVTSTTNLTSQQLNVTGITTLSSIVGTSLSITGISTIANFLMTPVGTGATVGGVGVVTYYGDGRNLTNIVSGYATTAGIATNATNVIGGIASVTSLNVSGITTLRSIVGTSLSITGISTIANFLMTPVGTGATVGGVGVVTYYGDGSGLTNINPSALSGIVTYADRAGIATNVIGGIASVSQLNVTGITTLASIVGTSLSITGISTLGTVKISSGIITATTGIVTYYGDGSKLDGVSAFSVQQQVLTASPVYPTFANGVGSTSLGISTTQVAYIPASGNLGIGTTNPTSKLTVQGDVLVSGVLTATRLYSGIYGEFVGGSISGSEIVGTSLSITGISTLGTVKISSGIITSTTGGIVTYYGDGSKLDNIIASSSAVAIATNTTNQSQFLTYVSQTGNVTGLGVTTTGLVFNPSTTRLGIGTTNPTKKLDVNGTVKATYFSGRGATSSMANYWARQTWTSRTSAADNGWTAVAWSKELGMFAAVAGDGTYRVMTSPNGITWTSQTTPAANSWRGICWAAELGLFVAVSWDGSANRVMTSPNGTTWTTQTQSFNKGWQSVCWSPQLGRLVAVSNYNGIDCVMYSSNGINWTLTNGAQDNTWNSVCWSPELGLFVAVSGPQNNGTGSQRVMTSTDGINWSGRTAAAQNEWMGLCWSPELGLFVAVSITGTGNRVMTSPDGTNWTSRTTPANYEWFSVCWAAELGLFVAVCADVVNPVGAGSQRVMTSPDGINWTIRTAAAALNWLSVCWSPEQSILAAVSLSGSGIRVMTSP